MDGILIIDKPAGITSHDVVSRVRRILKTKRVGHTGTLDPFATGVMAVVVGKATRLAQFMDKDEKEYEAVMQLGFETDTGDRTGMPCDKKMSGHTAIDWGKIFERFTGEISQTPPMYSAKKIAGEKLYEKARRGEIVERQPVNVTIKSLSLINEEPEIGDLGADTVAFRAACSAGTYIRTLAEDMARAAGTLGHLTELRRIRSGEFSLTEAVTLDKLSEADDPAQFLLPPERAAAHLSAVTLNAERIAKTRNGMSSRYLEREFADGTILKICGEDGELIAIGRYDEREKSVRPTIVLS